jgi:hypothetical protein
VHDVRLTVNVRVLVAGDGQVAVTVSVSAPLEFHGSRLNAYVVPPGGTTAV